MLALHNKNMKYIKYRVFVCILFHLKCIFFKHF